MNQIEVINFYNLHSSTPPAYNQTNNVFIKKLQKPNKEGFYV